ncbi:MAG TPA: pitrilysin family protein [Candidatus Polarisedimenticolia bacterium]|nr:pitrilysin family protein [Candidatus Polarisedimenticolia bacterium]
MSHHSTPPGLAGRLLPLAGALAIALFAAAPAVAQDIPQIEKNVTVHTLPNGWTFIIYERPAAPVFSFATHVNVGSAQEVPGITGIAHMFEHMAFKGTPNIGTTDYAAEKKALDKVDQAYAAYDAERRKPGADLAKVASLEKAWKDAQEAADKFIVKNEFADLVDREGGVGLNAGTGADSTVYFYSLPSNKPELWAYLESERFMHPVFREFYKERDVVKEERRLRTESQPVGRLIEQFISAAFVAHPYHHPVVGYMSDLDSFSREDAEQFYKTYYVPSNLVTAVVGDVKASELIPVIDKYFGRIPKGPTPPAVRTIEPPQNAERIIHIPDPSQPFYVEGYHKGPDTDPDDPVFDAIGDVLTTGRTSRLYRNLVRDKQLAVAVQSFSGFPGDKYPNLFVVFAVPARGHGNEEVRDVIRAELERLKTEDVTDEELAMVKTKAKASLIRGLDSNQGLAASIAEYQTTHGDWKELFNAVARIEKVTKADIRRVAAKTFVDTNRTVGMIETTASPAPRGGQPSGK